MDLSRLEATQWHRLLGRPPLLLNQARAAAALHGKRILITGAGGWIGSALTHAIAGLRPAHLVLLDSSERSLHEIDSASKHWQMITSSILGTVSDAALLAEIFERDRPQVVYHAAAFKHVPLMEQNPFAAVSNNVIGTHSLLQAALHAGAEQMILLSTDKAVDPASIMGASKRIAELLLQAHGTEATQTKALRLGNVLESEGSVVPILRKQIRTGGPVTVTHPHAERYFLTTADAVTLLLESASAATSSSILVPDLGEPVRLEALARYLCAELGREVPLVFTHLRPGDKLSESLLSARESYQDGADTKSAPDFPSAAAQVSPLRALRSPALPAATMNEVVQQLQHACTQRSLRLLLQAVSQAVPEYQPSALLQHAAARERA